MPRVKEFDEAEVLVGALDLFHERGFERTSFADLVGELGVSRQSLYDTYGNKETLYHAALRHYLGRSLERMRRVLAEKRPVREALAELFEGAIGAACEGNKGCMMVNAMIERSRFDADVRALAQEHARNVQELLAARLAAAQRAGEIGRDRDPIALGRYLYHTMLAVGVASRALGDRDGLRETVRVALAGLA